MTENVNRPTKTLVERLRLGDEPCNQCLMNEAADEIVRLCRKVNALKQELDEYGRGDISWQEASS